MSDLNLPVQKAMTYPAVAVKGDVLASKVVLQILMGRYSGVPVVDEKNRVIGIVTEMDLLKAIDAGKNLQKTQTKEIMTPDPDTITPQATVKEAMAILLKKSYLRLPVVDKGKLVGVISRGDILRAYHSPDEVTYL